jgi:hypothetical protein
VDDKNVTNSIEQQSKKGKEHAKTIRVDCEGTSYFGGKAFVPIVLADAELQALVESEIKLPTAAREIKSIKRNVTVTQCKAIPSIISGKPEVKVFISGVIHKNIQYVDDYKGYVHDFAVDVPFSCNEKFRVFEKPDEYFSQKSTLTNERIFIDKKGHGANHHESGGATFEFYNQPIKCELLFSVVNDLDLFKEEDKYGRFHKITEKAEVVIFFKLTQKQQTHFRPDHKKPPVKPKDGHQVLNQQVDPLIEEEQSEPTVQERIKSIVQRIEKFNG